MIILLRHIAVRLSLTVVQGIPLSFILISRLNGVITAPNPPLAVLGILALFFITTGFLMNMAGKIAIRGYIREAGQWERAGYPEKSKEKYLKAINIFDSYLLGPWSGRKAARELTGAIARFSLAFSNCSSSFEKAAAVFIKTAPHEKELISLWLKKVFQMENPGSLEHQLLTTIAESLNPDDVKLIPLMAKIFMKTRRTDFAAQKIFTAIQSNPDIHGKLYTEVNAFVENQKQLKKTINGKSSFLERQPLHDEKTNRIFRKTFKKIGAAMAAIPDRAIFLIIYIFKKPQNIISSTFKTVKTSPGIGKSIKWGIISILCSGLILLMANTFIHLSRSTKPPKVIEKKIEVKAEPKPFTIQVAAYLKKSHADKYVTDLKEKGLAAYITRTQGGGKTWYLVRISQFDSKKSAAEFGRDLKAKSIIDDFFVDNNARVQDK